MSSGLRVVLYCRQSESRPGEDSRTSLSVRSQQERGRAWAASIGGSVVAEIIDHDLRGADPARPGVQELLDTVRSQRVDAVWLFSLSRLARDLILQLMICRDIEQAGVQQIHSDMEGGIDDPFIRGIYGLMHEKATRQTSAHLQASFARRARDGGFPTGPTPMGYRRPHKILIHRANGTSYERETGEPVIDEDGAAFVREVFDRFDRGDSLHAITLDLQAQGTGPRGGTWERSTVRAMLSSPIYAGDIAHKGVVVAHDDKWAIIPRDQWDRVQAKLSRLPIVRRGGLTSWLEGFVYHACGSRMYFQEYQGKSAGNGRGMFVCRLGSGRCPEERAIIGRTALETVVRQLLTQDFADMRTPDEALSIAQDAAGGVKARRNHATIEKRLRDAQDRWKRNHERFSSGKLPAEIMDAEDALLAAAERVHSEALVTLPRTPDPAEFSDTGAILGSLHDVLPVMTPHELRRTVETLGTIRVSGDGVRFDYFAPYASFLPSTTIFVPKGAAGFRTP